VDYAMDVFKQLYPDSPDPEGENEALLKGGHEEWLS
jgi:hypothetical protein